LAVRLLRPRRSSFRSHPQQEPRPNRAEAGRAPACEAVISKKSRRLSRKPERRRAHWGGGPRIPGSCRGGTPARETKSRRPVGVSKIPAAAMEAGARWGFQAPSFEAARRRRSTQSRAVERTTGESPAGWSGVRGFRVHLNSPSLSKDPFLQDDVYLPQPAGPTTGIASRKRFDEHSRALECVSAI